MTSAPESAGGALVTHPHVPCLGCGCACDDIEVVVDTGGRRIVEARRACPLGLRWFGDGTAPARATVDGRPASRDEALDAATALLAAAARPLVLLAPGVTCEAQREGVALADLLRAALDSVTSATALAGVLAAQERGRAGATLGELRNRADVVLFWGVDPAARYPRFEERYAPDPVGTHVAEGRRGRVVVAVDVGAAGRGPADADVRVAVAPEDESHALATLIAVVRDGAKGDGASARPEGDAWAAAAAVAEPLRAARYAALVCDGEPAAGRDPARVVPLMIALAQALNAPTRAALTVLRGGGNRSGADAVLTWQTGFPLAVDFARGHPRYRPHDGTAAARLARGEVDAALVVGATDAGALSDALAAALGAVPCVVVGPRASEAPFAAVVAMDGGVAGIHEGGTALRMDDVPLPLRALLDGPPSTAALVRALGERMRRARRGVEQPAGAWRGAPAMGAGAAP